MFGKDWPKIVEHVGTREPLQVRSLGYNLLKSQAWDERLDLKDVVDTLRVKLKRKGRPKVPLYKRKFTDSEQLEEYVPRRDG